MRVLHSLFITLLFLGFSLEVSAQVPVDSVVAISQKINIPGIQAVHAVKREWHSYYAGVARNGTDMEINRETIFQAASLTKVITAYAFFRLYERGMMDLDTPLFQYYAYDRLKDSEEGQTITARMVLTHRTGLLNWEGSVGTQEWRESPLHVQFTPGSICIRERVSSFYSWLWKKRPASPSTG